MFVDATETQEIPSRDTTQMVSMGSPFLQICFFYFWRVVNKFEAKFHTNFINFKGKRGNQANLCFVRVMISLRIATDAMSTELHGALELDGSLLVSPGMLCDEWKFDML